MSDLFEKVTADQDPLRKLASKIPGFSGYIERENRRAADKLLRESIADQFEEVWKKVGYLQKDMASKTELDGIEDLETAAMKIRTFIDKIRNASYGMSGFFDAVKVNKDALAKIYEFDLALVAKAEELSHAVDNVEASMETDGMAAAVRNLVSLSRDLVSTFEKRQQVINEQ
jgi:hypothetical protein